MHATRYSTNSRSRRAVIGAALCASLMVPTLAASAAAGGHLYLQVGSSVERFPLVNGIPSAAPDLIIPHYGGVIAVAPDCTVYALHARAGGGFNAYDIFAFPPNQTAPSREIMLPRNGQCTLSSPPIQGLAVDGAGNLFVLVVYAQSGARTYRRVMHGDVFPICLGVAVFAPNANGRIKPLQTIALNDFYFGAMTVSSRGDDLYANLADYGQTLEFANAVQHPHQTRTLPAADNPGAATDAHGDVYLLTYSSGAFINVFAPSWISGPPTRSITLSAPFNTSNALAVRDRLAYLETLSGGAVGVYDARGNGPENPLATVNYSGLQGPMAVGP